MPLQDISKPACEEYKTQARQKRQKRVDEAEPMTTYLLFLLPSYKYTHCILFPGL